MPTSARSPTIGQRVTHERDDGQGAADENERGAERRGELAPPDQRQSDDRTGDAADADGPVEVAHAALAEVGDVLGDDDDQHAKRAHDERLRQVQRHDQPRHTVDGYRLDTGPRSRREWRRGIAGLPCHPRHRRGGGERYAGAGDEHRRCSTGADEDAGNDRADQRAHILDRRGHDIRRLEVLRRVGQPRQQRRLRGPVRRVDEGVQRGSHIDEREVVSGGGDAEEDEQRPATGQDSFEHTIARPALGQRGQHRRGKGRGAARTMPMTPTAPTPPAR